MNSKPHNFSATPVELRLKRSSRSLVATEIPSVSQQTAGERARLEDEWLALRETEENLRAYEAQLRAMQADIDARRQPESTTSVSPFPAGELSLQTAWDKLIRARELLDSEQASFRDDRMALKAEQVESRRQQANFAAREAALSAREQALPSAESIAAQKTMSIMTRLSRSPFEFARAVFRVGR